MREESEMEKPFWDEVKLENCQLSFSLTLSLFLMHTHFYTLPFAATLTLILSNTHTRTLIRLKAVKYDLNNSDRDLDDLGQPQIPFPPVPKFCRR